jgi:hypothetical protein
MNNVTALEQIYLEAYPPTRMFAVISWGAAATSWLAWALNSHPDIYCVHSANQFWRAFGRAPALDGVQYMRLLGSQGYAHVAAGDVHGVNMNTIPAIRAAFGDQFRTAVVIRDPIPRLRSQFGLFHRYKDQRVYDVPYIDDLIDSLDLPVSKDDYDRKLYLHGIFMLNTIIHEMNVGPVFKCEDLTSNPRSLEELVRAVAGTDIKFVDGWAERTVTAPRRNAHGGGRSDILSDPWLREMIIRVVKPEAWSLYEQFGYPRPSFVK